jgi:hypothetical protein
MNNKHLINEIELIKKFLTESQKALQDNNLQLAGDAAVGAQLKLKTVTIQISDMFNRQ